MAKSVQNSREIKEISSPNLKIKQREYSGVGLATILTYCLQSIRNAWNQ